MIPSSVLWDRSVFAHKIQIGKRFIIVKPKSKSRRSIIYPLLSFLLHQETDCCCRCYFLRHIRNDLPLQNIEWICFVSLYSARWQQHGMAREGREREIIETQAGSKIQDPSGRHKMAWQGETTKNERMNVDNDGRRRRRRRADAEESLRPPKTQQRPHTVEIKQEKIIIITTGQKQPVEPDQTNRWGAEKRAMLCSSNTLCNDNWFQGSNEWL